MTLYVEGTLTYRSWDDQNGQKRYATDVNMETFQLLTPRNQGNSYQNNNAYQSNGSYQNSNSYNHPPQQPSTPSYGRSPTINPQPSLPPMEMEQQDDDLPF